MALFRPFFIVHIVSRSGMLVWNPIKKLTGVTTFAKIGFSQYLSIKIIILGNTWKYGNISFPPREKYRRYELCVSLYNSLFVECSVYLISAFRRVLCLSFIRYCHSTTCYVVCYEWHEFHVASKILIFAPVIIYTSIRYNL